MIKFLIVILLCAAVVCGHPQVDQVTSEEGSKNGIEATKNAERPSFQGSFMDRTRLMNDLFNKYTKLVNPDNVKLQFGVNLIDFRVKEEMNAIESYVWLRYVWNDNRLSWNPEQYGGVEVLRINSWALWKPDVTLYNGVDTVNMINCSEHNTIVTSSGKISYIPPCKLTSQCEFNLWKHPYGDQTCSLKFGSWSFDGNMMDIQFYKGTKAIDLSQTLNSSGFKVVSSVAERHEKYYPCCKEPYPDLTFNMTIRRIPAEERFGKAL